MTVLDGKQINHLVWWNMGIIVIPQGEVGDFVVVSQNITPRLLELTQEYTVLAKFIKEGYKVFEYKAH
jgi:hypothetical protein